MGILSDIYISREGEAVKYDSAPDAFADRAQFRAMTPLEYSTLWTIMRGIESDVSAMDEFKLLLQVDGGERLVHSFPTAMIRALDQLTPEQIRDISTKWAATDELDCAPSDVQPVVEAAVRLARLATASGRGLYLWN